MHFTMRIYTLPVTSVAGVTKKSLPCAVSDAHTDFIKVILCQKLNSLTSVISDHSTLSHNPLTYQFLFIRFWIFYFHLVNTI